jgi:hypothetical protein
VYPIGFIFDEKKRERNVNPVFCIFAQKRGCCRILDDIQKKKMGSKRMEKGMGSEKKRGREGRG